MMVPLIQAVMQGSAGVRAQLGNPIRFFYGTAPLDTAMPYGVWEIVGGSPENLLSEAPVADGWRVRINVWGGTLSQANAAAIAIRDEVERRGSIESYNPTPDDDDTGAAGISFDAKFLSLRS
jgi:hypothetical protein